MDGRKRVHCYRVNCNKNRTKKKEVWCGVCRRVSYCSTVCQTLDLYSHKSICFPTLPERLRASCQLRLDDRVPNARNLSINSFYTHSGFKVHGDGYDGNRAYCVICEDTIDVKELTSENYEKYYILYESHIWSYHTCKHCTKNDRKLCPSLLINNYKCYLYNVSQLTGICLLLRLYDGISLYNDIIEIIIRYVGVLLPCNKCLYYHTNKKHLL